jgi:hypothetical protein
MSDMSNMENFKTVNVILTFSKTLGINPNQINSTTCSAYIDLNFIPDVVILKNISVYNDDEVSAQVEPIYIITSDLLNDPTIMIHFPDSTYYHGIQNIPFSLKKQISGKYIFRVLNMQMSTPITSANFSMSCAMTLLFVKYKNDKKNNTLNAP